MTTKNVIKVSNVLKSILFLKPQRKVIKLDNLNDSCFEKCYINALPNKLSTYLVKNIPENNLINIFCLHSPCILSQYLTIIDPTNRHFKKHKASLSHTEIQQLFASNAPCKQSSWKRFPRTKIAFSFLRDVEVFDPAWTKTTVVLYA